MADVPVRPPLSPLSRCPSMPQDTMMESHELPRKRQHQRPTPVPEPEPPRLVPRSSRYVQGVATARPFYSWNRRLHPYRNMTFGHAWRYRSEWILLGFSVVFFFLVRPSYFLPEAMLQGPIIFTLGPVSSPLSSSLS